MYLAFIYDVTSSCCLPLMLESQCVAMATSTVIHYTGQCLSGFNYHARPIFTIITVPMPLLTSEV